MIPQAIGFFGWKRPEIAKKTLAALSRCPGIENWPLVAFLDKGAHPEVIEAVRGWKGSLLLDCVVSDEKLGCSGNLTRGIMELFNICSERFIVLEDDCYPAEDFIQYMETMLGDDDILTPETLISVAAYRPTDNRKTPFIGHYVNDFHCSSTPGFHCWGWGTWKSRMGHFHNALIPVRGDAYDDSWDVRLNRYAASNGMGCIIPRLCHVLNIGTLDWTHTAGEDLGKDEYAGSEDPAAIRR